MTDLTFAVADLHGRYDLLEAALLAIAIRVGEATHKIVFLGDYVDRGPQSADVVERLVTGPNPGAIWLCLKGNHEAMMSLALRNPDRLEWWIENGGDSTIESYRGRQESVARHLRWMDDLPAIHIDAHRVYVHGGVDPAMPLDKQADKILLWKRYPKDSTEGHGAYHVVHGHDPNTDGPLRHDGRTDLDTLAWRTGRLAIGVFDDDLPGGPIDVIEVVRRPETRRAVG